MVAYTCRYSSGQLIPICQSVAVAELGSKSPLEYLQVQDITLVSLLCIYMIPTDCKITNFSLYLYCTGKHELKLSYSALIFYTYTCQLSVLPNSQLILQAMSDQQIEWHTFLWGHTTEMSMQGLNSMHPQQPLFCWIPITTIYPFNGKQLRAQLHSHPEQYTFIQFYNLSA